jgi:hypothetical protein
MNCPTSILLFAAAPAGRVEIVVMCSQSLCAE